MVVVAQLQTLGQCWRHSGACHANNQQHLFKVCICLLKGKSDKSPQITGAGLPYNLYFLLKARLQRSNTNNSLRQKSQRGTTNQGQRSTSGGLPKDSHTRVSSSVKIICLQGWINITFGMTRVTKNYQTDGEMYFKSMQHAAITEL